METALEEGLLPTRAACTAIEAAEAAISASTGQGGGRGASGVKRRARG